MGVKLLKNKTILVTGGAGFIGSNLCESLLNLDVFVVCLDDFSTGKKENIEQVSLNPRFKLIEGDIRNFDDCVKAVKGVDYVLHHAALGSVPRSIKNPIATNSVNVDGFLNMIKASANEGVRRFIFASSSSVYGDSNSLPKIEDEIGKPISPYAITKQVNELYADVFSKIYGIETIGLRYFNVFGRKQDPNGAYAAVIPKFVSQLMKGESPMVNGDGSFSRDFTYIDDVVQANILSLITKDSLALNTIYNVACNKQNTLNDLICNLKEFLSEFNQKIMKIEVRYGPVREGDIPHSLASVEKAKKYLKYNPKYSLKEGLKESVKWYWENL